MNRKAQQLGLALALFAGGIGTGVWVTQELDLGAIAQNGAEVAQDEATQGSEIDRDREIAQDGSNPELEDSDREEREVESQASSEFDLPSSFIADVAREVGPAVVSIRPSRVQPNRTVNPNDRLQPPQRGPFGRNVPPGFGQPGFERPEEFRPRGEGSGFIASSDGQIITNAHVVEGSDVVEVVLSDGRTYEGEVVGVDSVTDIAVVRIDAEGLPTVDLGDSDAVQPGEWAIAIGNPLGLSNTVTAGIVSAVGRSSSEAGIPNQRVAFIQTDTAINPGNSGGPLLNSRGEAIGVNTAIIRGAQGVGFAVPIDTARNIARQLEENGRVEHPFLGIEMVQLNPTTRDRLNRDPNSGSFVERESGVLIQRVVPDSPAARATIGIAIEAIAGGGV